MTRRNIIFKDNSTGKLYMTPEYNGDKTEFERIQSMDSCSLDWDEIMARNFNSITTLQDFRRANIIAQRHYNSFLDDVVGRCPLPIHEIINTNEIKNDEVYLIDNGVITKIFEW
jgi:hypothetical protein